MKTLLHLCLLAFLLPFLATAQVNSGSNGSDGAFNPTANVEIDMANHPDGIYHYTSVNIPSNVSVTFKPNAGNKPVVWLVRGDCIIEGLINIGGKNAFDQVGGAGGPGGYAGGSGGTLATNGRGPGGGLAGETGGSSGSFGTQGDRHPDPTAAIASSTYGNLFLLPLMGGSGGGGTTNSYAGGGGGGAILIAASNTISLGRYGYIAAWGGSGANFGYGPYGTGGSGGAVRLISTRFEGNGTIYAVGGSARAWTNSGAVNFDGGFGRIRIDSYDNVFGGNLANAVSSSGMQPIILPSAGQGIQLNIASVGGTAISASPGGVLVNPDVIISAQKTNPIPIVVNCSNIPLNTEITVKVHPANGADVQAVGLNNTGTLAASTATVLVNMPRGGGIIYASAVTGIAGTAAIGNGGAENVAKTEAKAPLSPSSGEGAASTLAALPLSQTGWTADGERFKAIEVTASLGGKQQVAYISESGKRCPLN